MTIVLGAGMGDCSGNAEGREGDIRMGRRLESTQGRERSSEGRRVGGNRSWRPTVFALTLHAQQEQNGVIRPAASYVSIVSYCTSRHEDHNNLVNLARVLSDFKISGSH